MVTSTEMKLVQMCRSSCRDRKAPGGNLDSTEYVGWGRVGWLGVAGGSPV